MVTLPPGEHQVKAIVTDSCADPGPQRCEVTRTVTVLSSEPPGEVSGRGEPRLRVAPRGTAVLVEGDPEVTAYNVYADAIGSWYGPTAASGSVCGIAEWTDNGDGTVTDMTTGVMWQQATEGSMNWEAAISHCEALSLAGYDDWRLPNRRELRSIVDYSRYNPTIDTAVFPGTLSSRKQVS